MSTLSARAAFKKQSGSLALTAAHLVWTADGAPAPVVRVAAADVNNLFSSKEGAADVRLKVAANGHDKAGYTFVFGPPQAEADRARFKEALTTILGRNRSGPAGAAAPAPPAPPRPGAPATPGAATTQDARAPLQPPPGVAGLIRPGLTPRATPTPRAHSVVGDGRSGFSPAPSAGLTAEDIRLRKKILTANPDLAGLHRDLVLTGQITEAEFWDGREYLLVAQASEDAQKKGRPGQLLDPRPETVDGGEMKIVITPQLVHDIFEAYPVVATAYAEVVPTLLAEAEFWRRYFQSKLYNAHRASIRSAAAQHVVKDDDIFDRYLEKDDDGLEPRRQRDTGVHTFIDLGATREDHGETGNENDVTMQAGRQRATLPLIRKFNEHSERLLKAAIGEERPAKKQRTESASMDDAAQLALDDLEAAPPTPGIVLDMQDRQRYFDGGRPSGAAADGGAGGASALDARAARASVLADARGWADALSALRLERKAAEAALRDMTAHVAGRLGGGPAAHGVPDALLRQMTTAQTAAHEFLRQFWLSAYPPPGEVAPAPPAQKAAKAARMAGFLARTPEKVDALVREAQRLGVEVDAVSTAMEPVMEAVNHALAFHQARAAAPTPVRR